MSAVSNSVMPRSIALWITLREVSRSVRWPKLLQPRPTAETRRPEPPRLRICIGMVLWGMKRGTVEHFDPHAPEPQGAAHHGAHAGQAGSGNGCPEAAGLGGVDGAVRRAAVVMRRT